MRKLRFIALFLAILISILTCVEENNHSCLAGNSTQMPVKSDASDLSHHHHTSHPDHFINKSTISYQGFSLPTVFVLSRKDQFISDPYLSSIWQPPQKSC